MNFLIPDQDLDDMIVLLDENSLAIVTDITKYESVLLDVYLPKISHSRKIDLVDVSTVVLLFFSTTFHYKRVDCLTRALMR